MNRLIILFFAAAISVNGFSQESEEPTDTLQTGGEINLNFSNTGFGEYYAGGGLGSTTIGTLFNTFADKTYQNDAYWNNSLRIDYGVARVENTNGENFLKSSDVLDVISKYGTPIKNSDDWSYSTAFNLLSQLTQTRTAYDEEAGEFSGLEGVSGQTFDQTYQSTFLAPADISLGIGVDYKPSDDFSAFIGPLSGKVRVIADDIIAQAGLFGNDITVENGIVTDYDKTRLEAGASALANYKTKLLKDDMLSFKTGLKLFSNYLEDPQNVDINWNTFTSLNPWKFITITYSTDLAYDDNKFFTTYASGEDFEGVKQGIQFRNVLGIGLVHTFGDEREE